MQRDLAKPRKTLLDLRVRIPSHDPRFSRWVAARYRARRALDSRLPAARHGRALRLRGGGSGDEPITGEEVVAAFEDAAGGYEFEETTSLVDGAVAYAPRNESDPAAVEPLNEALGESSLLWQVFVFEGSDPPLDEEAAKEVAFASSKLKQEGDGVYLGDNDTAYVVNGNVVADGDVEDETLKRWQAVLEEL